MMKISEIQPDQIRPEKTILIVDDDLIDRMILERWCLKRNISYVSASDGLEALSILQSNTIQFVFSDIDMPKINGLELVNSIRKKNNSDKIMVVAVSGNESLGLNKDFKQFGFDYYIPKPPLAEQLDDIYNAYLK